MSRFHGTHIHTLDNKGRLSIPSRYRDILKEKQDVQIFLTRHYGGYLLAFPGSEWSRIETKLDEKLSFRSEPRKHIRFLTSGVGECTLDRQGRILIPPNLRDYANLNKEVAVIGTVNCFEIWDRAKFEVHDQIQLDEASGNEEVIDELFR
jgi:MraZ protein